MGLPCTDRRKRIGLWGDCYRSKVRKVLGLARGGVQLVDELFEAPGRSVVTRVARPVRVAARERVMTGWCSTKRSDRRRRPSPLPTVGSFPSSHSGHEIVTVQTYRRLDIWSGRYSVPLWTWRTAVGASQQICRRGRGRSTAPAGSGLDCPCTSRRCGGSRPWQWPRRWATQNRLLPNRSW